MRNCAVKFASLSAVLQRDSIENIPEARDFLDLTPAEALQKFKGMLSDEARGVVMFGFSDQALLDILDQEFDVDFETQQLIFRKSALDSESIRLAGGGRASRDIENFTPREQTLIDNLALWLLDATRSLYREDLSPARIEDIKAEYAENLRVYARKSVPNYEPGDAELFLRGLLASIKAMNAFCHSLTVDAMFKADAAKILFGEESGYHQAWFRKQVFRHMMSRAVDQYIASCVV